ncbi:hypothetical protein SAMN06272771_4601 [Streptomyces sp. Ag82_O1-12]|uniref:hypothetical protein n=1 Tax=unclassified Streptomyces TaxID=2593676 RepID=UPI000BC507B2|nr:MULTISPECIES: hypothetical protein [unclassified Streptomyces]SMQ18161.1 hypothetical protein SAMN06272771_4601 [Streptomyces sp. Ag82_O1-12]SOD47198.1 hypothetical protein SAMN06272727_4601 [Streptomyces sp. Ag82_G6-1]
MARRALTTTAAAFATTAALLLTACGGGGDESSDDIKGADTGTDSPSASPSAASGRPDVSLPSDLKVEFDITKPSDTRHAAALDNAQNYILALNHGITAQNPDDPAYRFYALGSATKYAKSQIQAWVDDDWTATGSDSYYRGRTDDVGTSGGVLVTMCRDQSKFYGKNVKTKKIRYTKQSLNDFQEFRLLMKPPRGSQKVWKVLQIEVQGRVEGCRR